MTSDTSYLDNEEKTELVRDFLLENETHLKVLNDKLLYVEKVLNSEGGKIEPEAINAMFRAAHSIKGTASFLMFDNIVKLTHEMETLLQRVKNGEQELKLIVIDLFFQAFDKLEALFDSVKLNGVDSGDVEVLVEAIKEAYLGKKQDIKTKVEEEIKSDEVTDVSSDVKVEVEHSSDSVIAQKENDIGSKNFNDVYMAQYLLETDQNIEEFDKMMLRYEKEQNVTIINDIFRVIHTIKGSSGILNITKVQKVAHAMESILALGRDGDLVLNSNTVTLLFKAIDIIKDLVAFLKMKEEPIIDINEICGLLEKEKDNYVKKEVAPTPNRSMDMNMDFGNYKWSEDELIKINHAKEEDQDLFIIKFKVLSTALMKSMKVLLVEEKIGKKGSLIKINPSSAVVDDQKNEDLFVDLIATTALNEKDIRLLLRFDEVEVISIERLEIDKIITADKDIKPVNKEINNIENKTSSKGAKVETNIATSRNTPAQSSSSVELSTIRVDSNKIDNLMNLSGELVIVRARLAQVLANIKTSGSGDKEQDAMFRDLKTSVELCNREFKGLSVTNKDSSDSYKKMEQNLLLMTERILILEKHLLNNKMQNLIYALDEVTSSLGKISSDIQTGVMQTRMIPIEGIFNRFKRVVRDISHELNKEINLVIEGEDTELDKKIVDILGEPLTHMVRNSADHGIESAEVRKEQGKPAIGTITLKASHRGNNICIEIGDDGKGLDPDKILKKAVGLNLLTEEDGQKMSPEEVFNLIFLPGFSTAEKVTGISGRGVGMDVVKTMINSVNGSVDIQSVLGKGTNFTLKIPLTLAIIQALNVVIGDEIFAFPLDAVTEIIKIDADDIYSIDGNDTVKLRGHALSIVELENIIKVKGNQRDKTKSRIIVVITDGNEQLGVTIDSLVGKDEIVIKSLSEHFANVKGISGASILGDGRIALILDPIAIIKESW